MEVLDDLPRINVLSNSQENARSLTKNICKKFQSSLPKEENYAFRIDNKYYTADVLFCPSDDFLQDLSQSEALIFYHDSCEEQLLDFINHKVTASVNELEDKIFLLICQPIASAEIKNKVVKWCVSKKFELIELLDAESNEIEELKNDHCRFGIDRIIEALEAHMWPNIIMKGKSKDSKNTPQNHTQSAKSESNSSNPTEKLVDDFSNLLTNLKVSKESIDSLPASERKKAAERLVIDFWNAIGGSESEVEDLA